MSFRPGTFLSRHAIGVMSHSRAPFVCVRLFVGTLKIRQMFPTNHLSDLLCSKMASNESHSTLTVTRALLTLSSGTPLHHIDRSRSQTLSTFMTERIEVSRP